MMFSLLVWGLLQKEYLLLLYQHRSRMKMRHYAIFQNSEQCCQGNLFTAHVIAMTTSVSQTKSCGHPLCDCRRPLPPPNTLQCTVRLPPDVCIYLFRIVQNLSEYLSLTHPTKRMKGKELYTLHCTIEYQHLNTVFLRLLPQDSLSFVAMMIIFSLVTLFVSHDPLLCVFYIEQTTSCFYHSPSTLICM